MKRIGIVFFLLVMISCSLSAQDSKMEWWREARFGMFVHFGVYAQFGGVYRGHEQKVKNGEWLMNRMKVPVQEYKDTAGHFNPINFNADEWARMAKDAGMKYLVITAKHHDGFALFDTKASDWNIMKASPYGKDMIKPLADACRKYGLKFGIYYSQSQDWGNPGGFTGRRVMKQGWDNPDSTRIDAYTLAHNGSWDPIQQSKTFNEYLNGVAFPQVKELLSNYGDVSVLWWDTPGGLSAEQARQMMTMVKHLQPNIITNDRLGGNLPGDFKTPEQKIPNLAELDGKDWETCMTMNRTWGYRTADHEWKSSSELIQKLIDIAAKGGNYLLNIGPKPDGTFPVESVERLKEIGNWMSKYGEAIYGTHANPVEPVDWGRITAKDEQHGTVLYLSVFNWPGSGQLNIDGLGNKAIGATLLNSNAKLKLKQDEQGILEISGLPVSAPDKTASVIALKLNGFAKKKDFNPEKKMKSGSID
ncbi:alpha-L-fucosidase [Pedobacter heparinus]|uniref:alpha-L-fucosidase n=1 Tax=Pedobacter heparinus (strain ATCC 13125 / DSM 2366 / CIP 104194 / JCM 7457 / NBRC 12017 / NCIMB 9290 / NRRL B-14731 / HIM 762-3) TaxID=485917 RepID=C6Y1P8_PEDHD|nr:alpha-L-fucosidase [Pedobacter heparinus]ACU05040.1 Alpha-L-fucosidase [Pedobacter heparinus DSM 2366]